MPRYDMDMTGIRNLHIKSKVRNKIRYDTLPILKYLDITVFKIPYSNPDPVKVNWVLVWVRLD